MNHTFLRLVEVDQQAITAALQQMQLDWHSVCHVTATTSLQGVIAPTGVNALDIASLVDLIVMPGMPAPYKQDLSSYPDHTLFHSSRSIYGQQRMSWNNKVNGHRMRMSIQFENLLRTYMRTPDAQSPEFAAIFQGRREFYRTMRTLIASGVRPWNIKSTHPVTKSATQVWCWLENQLPALAKLRHDLWMPAHELRLRVNPESQDLCNRVLHALDVCFGPTSGVRTIVHHGFYYYTSAQWALFQLLGAMPNVQQIFIVHDDNQSPVFESWRAYFSPKLLMDERKSVVHSNVNNYQDIFNEAFHGIKIDKDKYRDNVTLMDCQSPAEFVSYINEHSSIVHDNDNEQYEIPLLYAADSNTLNRYHDTLNDVYVNQTKIDLSRLPVGIFLLRLHECIELQPNGIRYRLTTERIADMIASSMLTVNGSVVRDLLPTWMQVHQYFEGCDYIEDWKERASNLVKIISAYAKKGNPHLLDDIQRMQRYLKNPLRLLPWSDIYEHDAQNVFELINGIEQLLTTISSGEAIRFSDYMDNMRHHLRRGMAQLPQTDREQIEEKLDASALDINDPLHVDGLYDVIQIILGRHIEFNAFGEENDDHHRIKVLRTLDILGFKPSIHPIHIANLADGKFPQGSSEVGWPYYVEDLMSPGVVESDMVLKLIQMRSTYAEWGDIYLLWLALQGTNQQSITLSWISEIGSETFNRSAFLELIAEPNIPRQWTNVREIIGGLPTQPTLYENKDKDIGFFPKPRSTMSLQRSDIHKTLNKLPREAVATNYICARRFVLQWAMGRSAAFGQEHQHRMLYGNIIRLKERNYTHTHNYIHTMLHDVIELPWAQMTAGERESSYVKARLRVHQSWIYTLKGSSSGKTLYDNAYNFAKDESVLFSKIPVSQYNDDTYIPLVSSDDIDEKTCNMCPVKSQCAVFATK